MDNWIKKILHKTRDAVGYPDDRTNFPSLETMVGVPDAANNSLDDMLRTGFDSSAITTSDDGSLMERAEGVRNQLKALGHGGDIFFADSNRGDDTGDGFTPETAKKTIDAAVNLCAALHDDVVVIFASGGAAFDEQANTGGILLDNANISLIGIGKPEILNANGAGTAVITISANRCRVEGLYIHETSFMGINCTSDHNVIKNNHIWGDSGHGIYINGGSYNLVHDNYLYGMGQNTIAGIALDGAAIENQIYYNTIINSDYGLSIINAGCVNNILAHNRVFGDAGGVAIGISIAAGSHNGLFENWLSDCVDTIADAGTSTDLIGNREGSLFTRAGLTFETLEQSLSALSRFIADGDGDLTTGTALASNKSLVDALGTDGTTHTWGYDGGASVLGEIDGHHQTSRILFIIPEAVGSINAHNTAIQTALSSFSEIHTIVQSDALNYPNFGEYDLIVCGTDNGTAWVVANLAHVKEFPGSVLCVDASVAAYLEIGTDGGDAAAKTAITAIPEIESTVLGIGAHGFTGLAAGANTVSSSTTYNTLDMSDADLTETWYAYESVNANTDVVLGFVYKQQPDGTRGIDETALEVPGTRGFYGCAYSMDDLNTLGQAVFSLIVEMCIQRATTGLAVEISGDVGDIEKKIFGNQATQFTNGQPLVEFIAGQNTLGTRLAAGKSLYDTVGAVYVDGGGGWNTENVADDLNRLGQYLIDGTAGAEAGTALAAGESLVDVVDEVPRVQELVIYPVAEHLTTTELADDGTSPVYTADTVQTTASAISEGTGEAAWLEDIDFEQEGTVTVLALYIEAEWQTRFVNNGGGGTNSVSKFQISGNGGGAWQDVSDNFTNPAVAYTNRKRAGVGLWITGITAGANQLQFRILHWSDDGTGVDRSDCQIRSNTYCRILYRKS